MRRPILVDASYLIALHYRKDKNHQTASLFEQSSTRLRLIPDVVLPEASHMLDNYLGQPAVLNMIQAVLNSPAQLMGITKPDLQRAYEVMQQYKKAQLDLADCCVIALAERLNIAQILTFRRDFSIIRPKHTEYFELLS